MAIPFDFADDERRKIVEIIGTVGVIDNFTMSFLEEYYSRLSEASKANFDIQLLKNNATSIKKCNENKRIELVATIIPVDIIGENFVSDLKNLKDIRNELAHQMQRCFLNTTMAKDEQKVCLDTSGMFKPKNRQKVEELDINKMYRKFDSIFKKHDDILQRFFAGEEYLESLFPQNLRRAEEILW